jgi:sarcosine oxidase subunit gamma
VELPPPGRLTKGTNAEIAWAGQGQFFVFQPDGAPGLPSLKAAVTDQSDGWVAMLLEGEHAKAVLARLCPLDLRALSEGDAVRSLVGHMNAVMIRRAEGVELMVFRSMTQTLVHELDRVMRSVAAQASGAARVL